MWRRVPSPSKRRRYPRAKRAAITIAASFTLLAVMVLTMSGSAYGQSPQPTTTTPIEHFIFLMQENHSFDNYFGTYPGANGIPADTCMPVDPYALVTDCVEPFHIGDLDVKMDDPDHSDSTHQIQYNEGKMDGFVYALNLRNQDGRLAMGYYDDRDLPFHWNIAEEYVLFDNFFSSAAGGSAINHNYWVAATAGIAQGRSPQDVLKETTTIFDVLEEEGISWKFYVQNYEPDLTYRTVDEYPANRSSQVIWVPLLNMDRFLDTPELNSHIVDMDTYFDDLANGTLPAVAFMTPSGPSEHPPSSLLSGQRNIKILLQSLMQSSYWDKSAFLWSYDDWGGWYDHVPPPQVDDDGYGFRVPALLVSAYARRGYIDSTQLDYTSALKFIQENWGLEPLAERDAKANSIANAFDFSRPARPAEIVPLRRSAIVEEKETNRSIIFISYGSALLLSAGVVTFAYIWPKDYAAKYLPRSLRKALKKD
jgi:phospholipase C